MQITKQGMPETVLQARAAVYPKTVLCIDDDHDLLAALYAILKPIVANVIRADNGEDGIRMALQERPDLILLDVNLPETNGYQVFRKLKELGFTSTPVVLLTANDEAQDLLKGYDYGCAYYITKPFKKKYVINIIDYFLGDLSEAEKLQLELQL